jgi:hypothetical protein
MRQRARRNATPAPASQQEPLEERVDKAGKRLHALKQATYHYERHRLRRLGRPSPSDQEGT